MVFIALLLSIIGILEIFTIDKNLAYKQISYLIFSVLFGYLIYRYFKVAYIRMLFYPILFLTIILLILVHFSPSDVNRWIDLKFFYFQPSELSKILF